MMSYHVVHEIKFYTLSKICNPTASIFKNFQFSWMHTFRPPKISMLHMLTCYPVSITHDSFTIIVKYCNNLNFIDRQIFLNLKVWNVSQYFVYIHADICYSALFESCKEPQLHNAYVDVINSY